MLKGGCFCGLIRYEAAGTPFHETSRHCSSTAKGTRSFCPRCGAQLTFEHADFPEEMDVTTGSLDEPGRVPPKDHTWIASKLVWIELADRLPQYAGRRPPH